MDGVCDEMIGRVCLLLIAGESYKSPFGSTRWFFADRLKVMKMLSPHRRFIGPDNVDGIPGVSKRRAKPKRENPLPGTKNLVTEKDPRFQDLVTYQRMERVEPSRVGKLLGNLALVMAVMVPSVIVINALAPESHAIRDFGAWFSVLGFILVHLFAIFSQVLSGGKNFQGCLAIPVLYVSFIVCVIIDHLMHRLG